MMTRCGVGVPFTRQRRLLLSATSVSTRIHQDKILTANVLCILVASLMFNAKSQSAFGSMFDSVGYHQKYGYHLKVVFCLCSGHPCFM